MAPTLCVILRELGQLRDREQHLRFVAVRFGHASRGINAEAKIAGIAQARYILRVLAYQAHTRRVANSK